MYFLTYGIFTFVIQFTRYRTEMPTKISLFVMKMLENIYISGVLLSHPLGKLVFKRILDKSVTYVAGSNAAIPLKENFSPEEVPDSAKETCRNWFYKIASIRELIPRLYPFNFYIICFINHSFSVFFFFKKNSPFSSCVVILARVARWGNAFTKNKFPVWIPLMWCSR